MHCQRCGYLLFNLNRADCPECGEVYDIERYRFVPRSVAFHCPHCDQPYYGNDPQGLPWPREFRCAQCGNMINLREMRVVPLMPDAVGWAGSAWDNRERLGFWRAWWQTLGTILFHPSQFFRNHQGASTWEAFLFCIVSLYIGLIPAISLQFTLMSVLLGAAAGGAAGGGGGVALPLPMSVMVFLAIVVALLAPLFAVFISGGLWTLMIHLALLVVAPNRKPMGYTFRTVLYSMGVHAISAIPLCGPQAAGIWNLVTLIHGIKEVHHTTGGRAALAVLWPLIAGLVLYLVIIAIVFVAAARS